MAQQGESGLQRRIQKRLRAEFPGAYVRKIHVSEFQQAGIADLLCCIHGRFFALEVKRPGEERTELQLHEAKLVRTAKGVSAVVTSPDEAVRVVWDALNAG